MMKRKVTNAIFWDIKKAIKKGLKNRLVRKEFEISSATYSRIKNSNTPEQYREKGKNFGKYPISTPKQMLTIPLDLSSPIKDSITLKKLLDRLTLLDEMGIGLIPEVKTWIKKQL